jgi:hypothetical protein
VRRCSGQCETCHNRQLARQMGGARGVGTGGFAAQRTVRGCVTLLQAVNVMRVITDG